MTPIRDGGHNVLRQIWIDQTTDLPVRYLAERFVDTDVHPYTYAVTVDAQVVDGVLVNVDAHGISRYGPARWRITQISFPPSEPSWVFDQSQWKQHDGQPIPGFAPQ
ncbi:MAG TPA: hypothetical protein VMF61_01685 [Candidatus Acidoferrales bacterium]|nr:hypothetical protein [Candidatus Acidoferrales bacterium]